MKPAYLWLAVLALLLVADGPPAKRDAPRTIESSGPVAEAHEVRRATQRMAAVVSDLQATRRRNDSRTGQSAGDLWTEVNI
jgi:hypothetical protein